MAAELNNIVYVHMEDFRSLTCIHIPNSIHVGMTWEIALYRSFAWE